MGKIWSADNTSAGEYVEQKRLSFIAGWNAKCYSYWEHSNKQKKQIPDPHETYILRGDIGITPKI